MRTPDRTRPVAVVSGGSSGLGRAFVLQLQQQGYQVIAFARDPARLAALQAEAPEVLCVACDVTDAAALARLADRVDAQYGKVDLLVSNAGGAREVDFAQQIPQPEAVAAELRLNLEAPVQLVAAFLPLLRKGQRAAILFVTSGYALAPAQRAPLYSAAKAGLRSFAKALRRQLAPLGITVTELAPPVVDTPAVAHRQVPKLSADAVAELGLRAVRRGDAEAYPGVVRWLPLALRLAPRRTEDRVARS